MTEVLYDRRKNLYCGPDHEVIPTLDALANSLTGIQEECKNATCTNYAHKLFTINALVNIAIAEVDKLIRKDIDNVIKKEKL